jgi:hypothetical protein
VFFDCVKLLMRGGPGDGGRVAHLFEPGMTSAAYETLGTLKQLDFANGVSTTPGWNNCLQMTSLLTQKAGGPIHLSLTYLEQHQLQLLRQHGDHHRPRRQAAQAAG